jgi:hypothetical protein
MGVRNGGKLINSDWQSYQEGGYWSHQGTAKAGTDISKAQLSGFVGAQEAVGRAGELRAASKKLNL